ncbi:MAG: hypothetical protein Kow0074_01770 [Candidatus Zixiibacteriota bacterium]
MLVAAEIVARLVGWPHFAEDPTFPSAPEWSYPRYIERDTKLFWRYRPNQDITGGLFADGHYRINAHGFRGPDFTIKTPDNRQRVVCLGGSTTFGLGVTDGREYPRQIEQQLNRLDPERRQWEVLNLGVTNYSTLQGLRLAEEWIPRLEPDVVVLNFSWGDHQRAHKQIADEDRSMPPSWMLDIENTLMTSAAAQWACRFWQTINPPPPPDTMSYTPVWRVGLTGFNANIERITAVARNAGARCIVASSPISWPPAGLTDSSGIFHYHHRYHRVAKYAATASGAEFCEVANYFNLHPEFFEIPPTQYELFNADGHAFAGDLIARCILGLPLDSARVFDVRGDWLDIK